MKSSILVFIILLLYQSISLSQDKFPRFLPKVDTSQIWHSVPGIIPENNIKYEPLIEDIINQTNLDSLISYVRIISGEDFVQLGNSTVYIKNRGSISGGDLAADYLLQKLESFNLDVYDQTFRSSGRNIYAVQSGYLFPEKQFIICAHYDAVDTYGADDNASGVAAVLEAARILSKYDFKYTLIYALWDEKEIGLYGSKYYATEAASKQVQIQGVLNMDMIGWDGNNDWLADVHTWTIANANDLGDMLIIVNWLYELPLNLVKYNPGTSDSDHSSFWNIGMGAILLMEAYYGGDLNPYYHENEDRIDKFNLPYFHNLSRLSIGTISTLIEVTKDTIIGAVIPEYGFQTYSPNIQIKGVKTHFEESSGTLAVWLSRDAETIIADSFIVNSNTSINAYFKIPLAVTTGWWDVNVQTAVDGIITKEGGFNILPPPALIFVSADSLNISVQAGNTEMRSLTIYNSGDGRLIFNITTSDIGQNYALHFDGINDYAEVKDDPSLQITTYFTVEAWGYFNVLPISQYDHVPIVWRGNNIGWGNDYHFRIAQGNGSGVITWGSGGQDGGEYYFDGGTISTEKWYHFAYVANGSNLSGYINGELVGSNSGNPPYMVSGYKTYFGSANRNGTKVYTNGNIDEVRIWRVARTQEEIQRDMYKQLMGSEPNLVSYWRFNEKTGNIAYDISTNGNDASLMNGVSWITYYSRLSLTWIDIEPDTGAVSAGLSTEIILTFDAKELGVGKYDAALQISSNDPFIPVKTIPIHITVTSETGIDQDLPTIKVFKLEQNYPNPFNPSTTIEFALPKTDWVTLKIFNILGQQVATLVSEKLNSGVHKYEWQADNLPSGVYFYQLRTDSFVSTKKFLLLR